MPIFGLRDLTTEAVIWSYYLDPYDQRYQNITYAQYTANDTRIVYATVPYCMFIIVDARNGVVFRNYLTVPQGSKNDLPVKGGSFFTNDDTFISVYKNGPDKVMFLRIFSPDYTLRNIYYTS